MTTVAHSTDTSILYHLHSTAHLTVFILRARSVLNVCVQCVLRVCVVCGGVCCVFVVFVEFIVGVV